MTSWWQFALCVAGGVLGVFVLGFLLLAWVASRAEKEIE